MLLFGAIPTHQPDVLLRRSPIHTTTTTRTAGLIDNTAAIYEAAPGSSLPSPALLALCSSTTGTHTTVQYPPQTHPRPCDPLPHLESITTHTLRLDVVPSLTSTHHSAHVAAARIPPLLTQQRPRLLAAQSHTVHCTTATTRLTAASPTPSQRVTANVDTDWIPPSPPASPSVAPDLRPVRNEGALAGGRAHSCIRVPLFASIVRLSACNLP